MKSPWIRLALAAPLLCAACVGSKIVAQESDLDHAVARIAASPSGGEVADAVVAGLREIEDLPVEVLDTQATGALLQELGIRSVKATLPENLARLKENGVDAWLRVEENRHMISDDPGSIEVVLLSTRDPEKAIEFVWKNARGGMRGSIADATVRLGTDEAGVEIANEIANQLRPYLEARP